MNARRLDDAQMEGVLSEELRVTNQRWALGSLLLKPYSADSKDHRDSAVMAEHDGAPAERVRKCRG